MASISDDPNGRRRILFVAPDGSRKSIRLGKCDRKSAESINRHVEMILSAKIGGQPLPRETAAWLAGIGDVLKEKLAAVGLVDAPQRAVLGEFLSNYILNRPDVKPATLTVWAQPCRNLNEFFGANKPLRDITAGNADQFKAWLLTQKLAPATLAKRLQFARTFFNTARKHRFIDVNPFEEVKIPTANISERQRFVGRDTIARVMELAKPDWRTIIALARFGGLRCPSEVLSLEWRHIDWHHGRVTVPSPKTERYEHKGSRVIPLFPELKPYLEDAFELAKPGQAHVVGGDYLRAAQGPNGWMNCNLRSVLMDMLKRAGVDPWPRLFHNLRSSRETELLEEFPSHVVAAWMGHSVTVSTKHYAQITDDHFQRATGGAESGAPEAQNAAQQAAVRNGSMLQVETELDAIQGLIAIPCSTMQHSEQDCSGGEGI